MSQKHIFKNKNGENLSARMELSPYKSPIGYAIYAHCFTCSKDIKSAYHISNVLAEEGIGVLRFDFTGLGESEGLFHETNFSSNVDDIVSASDFLKEVFHSPTLLIGHSLGGAAVIEASLKIPSVRAVVTIGAPFGPSHIERYLLDAKRVADEVGEANIHLTGRSLKLKKHFFEDLNRNRFEDALSHLNRALLVIHSPLDSVVGIEQAGLLLKKARHPKSFISIDGADHMLSNINDAKYAGKLIAIWSKRYI